MFSRGEAKKAPCFAKGRETILREIRKTKRQRCLAEKREELNALWWWGQNGEITFKIVALHQRLGLYKNVTGYFVMWEAFGLTNLHARIYNWSILFLYTNAIMPWWHIVYNILRLVKYIVIY